MFHASGASLGSLFASIMSTRVQRRYRGDMAATGGVTELLCFEGLGKVLPREGAMELAFEDWRIHQVKGGPG